MRTLYCLWFGLFASFVVGGCSSPAPGTCDPACASGKTCLDGACVTTPPPPPDLAVPADLAPPPDMTRTCEPACNGATPYCKGTVCVACLVDANCPAGNLCKAVGNIMECLPGCNDDSRCNGGGLPGDGGAGGGLQCCGGQCLDVSKDAFNCGGCGTVCMASNAGVSCASGVCTSGACMAGWGDCNMNPKDGCETNLRTDVNNCKMCGKTCSFPNGVAGCDDNGCYLRGCGFGWDDCNQDPMDGCEASVLKDPNNCGACGNPCVARPHATSACTNANCAISSCNAGYADCNGDPKDGCEINVLTDTANCGKCGAACGQGLKCQNGGCTCPNCNFFNAKSTCINLVCVMGACLPGNGDCNNNVKDGCETDLTADVNNCGACGKVCGGMTPYCQAGVCTSNPCTGQVGGPIGAAMGMPSNGFCWYLSIGGASCDAVCAASGGTNQAVAALAALPDDCMGGAGGQPSRWFFDNANSCLWVQSGLIVTGYKTLGHGYHNDQAGRAPNYYGKCGNGLAGSGTMPGDANDSVANGSSRCVVCACDH